MDTNHYKEKLEKELATLEAELKTVGEKNPDNPNDWEAVPPPENVATADENDVADTIEDFETNTAILKRLEIRYNEVKDALGRIGNGTYGTCEISGDPIEQERLEANPAARTCIKHKDQVPQ
jgi:RNA polymerase-binding transcription factor DksA